MLEVIRRLGIFPHTCVLELTLRCNFRCRHCGSHAGQPRPEELSTEEWLRICDELVELHCERVTLSGGEPTMHPDWALIGKSLADRGVCVNVVSNGSLWTDEVTRQAMAAGLNNVGFSLDGLAATHDEWRAFPGSFERIMAALASCRRHHFRSSVVTVLNRRNIAELRELRALLAERGVRWWQCQLGTPSGELRQHPEWLLNAEDLLEVVPLLAELRAMPGRPHLVLTDNVGYYGKYEAAIRKSPASWGFWMGCRAGLQTIGIES
ncbi:MAG: radical SAM protein, partial [Myxococcota bacterium]|nr:radical SAM protein [Myxococcota bacterium]